MMRFDNAEARAIKQRQRRKAVKRIFGDRYLHLLVLPAVLFYLIFAYYPMYGIIVAFKDFSFGKGILGSPWAAQYGLKHFRYFFESMYFGRLVKNTALLSFYSLIFSFPIPVVFALLLNEVGNRFFKRLVQSVSYFPYFVSVVITVGIMKMILHPTDGIVNKVIVSLGGRSVPFMQNAGWFRPLFIISGIWQSFGWNSILYLAALSGVSSELYEAAEIDGAGYFKKAIHISLPGIMPTIIIMLILSIGGIMSVGAEKVILMYSPSIYDVADVISSYVYRAVMVNQQFSFSAAVGLFNSVINFVLLFSANVLSRKLSETSLW